MKLSLERKIYLGFGLGLLILSVVSITSSLSLNWLLEADAEKEQTSLVRAEFNALLSDLKDVGAIGYVVTGDERYLEPYQTAIERVDQRDEKLRQLAAADPQLQRHLATLEPLIERRFAITKQLIDTRRDEGFEVAVRLVDTDEGKRVLDAIRREIGQIEAEQSVQLQQQSAIEEASMRQATLIISGSSLLAVIIVVVAIYVIKLDLTQRKRLEEALSESGARFRAMFEEAAIGMALTDMPGRIVASNPALQKMVGYTAAELSELASFAQFTHPDDVPLSTTLRQELIEGKRHSCQIEKRYLHKDGQVVWGRLTASLVRDNQGHPRFVLEMIEDITEHKQAEEALRQSREKYRLVVESVKEVIFQVDPAGYFTFLNPAWTEITGFPLQQCLGTSYLDYIHPDDRRYLDDLFQALLAQDLDYCRHALRLVAQDGHLCWIEVYAQLARTADGTILGISGTLNDISDRKRAEQALQTSENRFRTLTHHAPVGIFETDARGNFIFVNQRWYELTGMIPAEALGHGWIKALHPDDRERVLTEWLATAQAGQESFTVEYRIQTPGGKTSWVVANAVTLRNEAGELAGYLGTVTDITASKEVEEILGHRAAQLMLINDISSKIAAVLELDSLLAQTARLVQSTFDYHHVALFLLDNQVARLKAIAGSYSSYFPPNHTQELDRGIIGWVATHGEKVVANDVGQEPRYISKIADKTVTRAELCLPIKVAGQTVGVLDIQSPHLGAFDENDIMLMEILVDQIAVAIENARLYQAIRQELAERKQTEEALATERNLLRTLIDNLPDLVFVKDTESRLLLVNRASLERGQQTVDELIGKTDFDLHPPELAAQYYADDQAVIQSGQAILDREEPNIDAAGRLRWFSTTKVPLRDSQGQIIGLVGLSRNITERKRMEEALAQERNLLRTLIDHIPDYIYVKDTDSRFVIANPATARVMGVTTPDELIGKSDFDFYPPALAAKYYEDEQAIFKSGRPLLNYEESFIDQTSGQEGWLLTTKVPLWDGQGQLLGLVGIGRDITERRRMEQALRQSEERFALAVYGSNDGIWDYDLVNNVNYWSPRLIEMHGYDPQEFEAPLDKGDSFIHPDDLERFKASVARHLKDRAPLDAEFRARTKSGEYRWFRIRGQAVWDETGRPVRAVGSTTDITERKQTEEALRESEERYRLLFKSNPHPMWVYDLETLAFLDVNDAAIDHYGYSREEFLAMTIKDIRPSEDIPALLRIIPTIDRGLGKATTWRHRKKDGTLIDVEITAHTLMFAGRPASVVLANDITERKRMEAALAEERNLLHTVINATPDWIFIKDQDHRFRLVNRAYAQLFNLSPEEVVGKTDLDLGFPEDIVKGNPEKGIRGFWTDDREVMDSGQVKHIAEEPALVNGQPVVLSTVKVPLQDAAGKVWGVLGFAHDITHLKRVQEELQQAKETAEAATRAKSAFLANMSHEIRTPLNAIIGMTSLLLDTPLSPEQREFAETVRISGDTLLTIINDILDFSKIEAGKLELEEQAFDLRQAIEHALDLVAVKAAEKKLELAYLIDDGTPGAIVGDMVRLHQILANLLSNAVKFTDAGEVIVSVTSRPVSDGQSVASNGNDAPSLATRHPSPIYELHFAVRDTGLGIPPDRLDRLFKAFSQVDVSTTRKYGGTGLGLAISNRLCQLMGGQMWVESAGVPGQGSVFHFTIRAPAAPSQPRIYLRGQHSELTGKRLLVVDDNATNRLVLERQVQMWSMCPTTVASGAEALALLRQGQTFDLAILDMQMPEMDGLTLAAEIRRLEETMVQTPVDHAASPHLRVSAPLPLVMLTSLGQRDMGDPANGVEFAAILNKPIKSSQLYDALIGVFNQQPIKVKPNSVQPSPFGPQLGRRHPLRILLAEDNVINQKVALRFLDKLGYQADVAANGLEVIAALQRQPYDVILMDVQMPEMDGLETTRLIRQQWPETQQPRIIAMTANALQGDRELCLEAGMDDYIGKPVRIEALSRALSESQPHPEQIEVKEASAQPDMVQDQLAPALDPGGLAKLREILGEQAGPAITELIDLFIDNGADLLEKMRAAIQAGDAAGSSRAAHTLKPGGAHLGAMRLAALCSELEDLDQAEQLKEAAEKFCELEAEFKRVKAALEAERDK